MAKEFKKVVLLVDDSPTVGRAIGQMLDSREDTVFCYCREAEQAIDVALRLQPTVVLMDLVMPDIDGLTLLSRFREHPELASLPVVMLSSKESPEVKARAFAAGANDYLVKVPAEAELLARISHQTRVFLQHDSINQALRNNQRELREQNQRLEQLTQELRLAHQEAVQASRAKSAFLANMSHEIRTPMNAIIGLTDLCLEGDLTSTQREFLTNVSRSADSLLRIINDILDLSKIEAGLLDFDPQPFSLRDLLDQVAKMMALKAHAKSLELVWEMAPEVPDSLLSDALRLRQVLLNLLGNAIKFTHDGEISITVTLHWRENDQLALQFAVRDTGIGVPGDKLETIFEAFTQADGSTTRLYGGTGLGLTISASLVEMMEGRIWVESEVGHGSCFYFTLRCQEAPEPVITTLEKTPEIEALAGLRVLIVDDNRTNLRILQAVLENHGMVAYPALSGREALSVLDQAQSRQEPIELVITDAHMPEMDGFMLAEALRGHAGFIGAQIMMLSSSNLRGDMARCREVGIDTHLTKPVSQGELLKAIAAQRSCTARSAPAPEAVAVAPCGDPARQLSALLVEDNPINQIVALALLERLEARVEVANDGPEAIEHASRQAFDFILMDVQMPGMDGFETTARLRELGVSTPIIALTAHALKGDAERCLRAGMDAYVAKPIQEASLRQAVSEVMSRPAPAPVHSAEAPVRVLVIDDSSAYRNAITAALRDERIEVVGSASDGLSGLAAIEQLRPDVVTLDLEMPGMDGLSALRELRARSLGTGVVMVSTQATRVAREALDLGVDHLVMKPESGLSYTQNISYLRERLVNRVLELGRMTHYDAQPHEEGPFQVLVLDDSGFQRRQVCRYFRSRGLEPVEAASVTEAVEQLSQIGGADLIMVDLFLPGQDGLQMIRELRRNPRFLRGRIVIMSSENDQEEILRCVEAGADEYLMKPFDAETLYVKLRHVFGAEHPIFGENIYA